MRTGSRLALGNHAPGPRSIRCAADPAPGCRRSWGQGAFSPKVALGPRPEARLAGPRSLHTAVLDLPARAQSILRRISASNWKWFSSNSTQTIVVRDGPRGLE